MVGVAVTVMSLVSFVFLGTARSFLGDTLMFCVFINTNVMMAIGPALFTLQRGDRVRGSVGLAFFIALWTMAAFPRVRDVHRVRPGFFSRPSFFVLGTTCLTIAVWHLVRVRRLSLRNDQVAVTSSDAVRTPA